MWSGPCCRCSAWAASCSASSSGRRAASRSAHSWSSARSRWDRSATGSIRRKREGKPTLIDPDLFRSKIFRLGITGQMLQQIALGGAMIALPIYLQMVLEYNAMQAGLSIAPALAHACSPWRCSPAREPAARRPSSIIRVGFALLAIGMAVLIPIVPRGDSGWCLLVPLVIAGSGLGLLVSQLNNYTLSPIAEERVSEAAGVNSAAGRSGCRSAWRSPAPSCWRRSRSPSRTWRSPARCSRPPNSSRSRRPRGRRRR